MNVKNRYILLVLINILLSNNFIPFNESNLNYTQVFFKWPQINTATYYEISIISNEGEVFQDTTNINSIIVSNFLDWNLSYNWNICGFDESNLIECYDTFTFTINPLPDFFPNDIQLLILDEEQYHNGITIVDFDSKFFSAGLDKNGYPIWFSDKELFPGNNPKILVAQVLNNGNFIGYGNNGGYEFDINSNIVFQTPIEYGVHHHIIKIEDTYLLIDTDIQNHQCPEPCPDNLPEIIPWKGDKFIQLDNQGNLIWEWNTFDYINLSEYNPYYLSRFSNSYPNQSGMDWTHSNSVFYDYINQNVYLSVRNLSRIIKIDYQSKDIIWELGESSFMDSVYYNQDFNFSQQHSVQVLNNQNILFFDNHSYLDPEISRCKELSYDSISDSFNLEWEFILPDGLFTGSRGECDRLVNGNTLITAGRTGNILEVNNNNDIVWNLRVKDDNTSVSMFRSNRIDHLYPLAFSFIVNSFNGSFNDTYYMNENQILDAVIYNQGWSSQIFSYLIIDSNENEIYSNMIEISSNSYQDINIDLSNLIFDNNVQYIFKVLPNSKLSSAQSVSFIIDNIIIGDINNDLVVNVLDAISLVNQIISSNYSNSSDLNNDQTLNILDIILLINIILNR